MNANERSEKIYLLSTYLCEEGYFESLVNARDELEKTSTVSAVTYDRPAVQTGPGDPSSRWITAAEKLEKLNRVIRVQRQTTDKALDDLEIILKGFDTERERRIFRLRYICGYEWRKISIHMGVSEPTLYRIHGRILDTKLYIDNEGILRIK